MSFASGFRSTVVMAAIASAVGCIGNIGSEGDAPVAQSEEDLRRAPDPSKELVITDFSVIESPEETTFDYDRPSGRHRQGAWTFGRLVHNMLPEHDRNSAKAASDFAYGWLHQWETDQAPNDLVSLTPARKNIRSEVINPWKVSSGCAVSDTDDDSSDTCQLDMGKAPFRLIAIVYRPDLRITAKPGQPGEGGEGRFVFELYTQKAGETAPSPKKMTVIFEYSLPIWNNFETLVWSYRFHTLGAIPFGEGFNAVLHTITNDFSGPDADPRRPNGNAIDQVRTNELSLVAQPYPVLGPFGRRWELREFHLHTDGLHQAPVAQEPSRDFDTSKRAVGTGTRSAELGDYMMANADAIKSNTHTIPAAMLANSSLVGTGFPAWGTDSTGKTQLGFKDSKGNAVPKDVRDAFALNTCAGCHRAETATFFLHLTDRRALNAADPVDAPNIQPVKVAERDTQLSPFLQSQISAPTAALPDGGERYADYVKLLNTKPWDVAEKPGMKACKPY